MNAIGYLRASTGDQAIGLEAQRQQIAAYCSRKDLVLVAEYTDEGVSGGTSLAEREGLTAAVEGLDEETVLVVAKLDRLGRDSFEVLIIERAVLNRGSRIASTAGEGTEGSTPANTLMRSLIVAVAEYERAIIRSRIKGALAAKKANGERVGSIPYGMKLDTDGKTLVRNMDEYIIIMEARALRASDLSYGKISKMLAGIGRFSRKGKPFHGQQIKRMMIQPTEET